MRHKINCRWIAFALLINCSAAPWYTSTVWGQRPNDGVDEISTDGLPPNEPPRLMRGGLMQQLRSVTESVFGSPEDRQLEPPSSGMPTPHSLSAANRGSDRTRSQAPRSEGLRGQAPRSHAQRSEVPRSQVPRSQAPREDFSGEDFSGDFSGGNYRNFSRSGSTYPNSHSENYPDETPSTENERGRAGGLLGNRAWAGQFLIPNPRVRDQFGIRRPTPAELPERSAAEYRQFSDHEPISSPTAVPNRQSKSLSQPPSSSTGRLYLGQSATRDGSPSASERPKPNEIEKDPPSLAGRSTGSVSRPSRSATSNAPFSSSSAVRLELTDDDRTTAGEPALTTNLPAEIPFVPRKAVPKREAGKSTQSKSSVPSPIIPPANSTSSIPAATPAAPERSHTAIDKKQMEPIATSSPPSLVASSGVTPSRLPASLPDISSILPTPKPISNSTPLKTVPAPASSPREFISVLETNDSLPVPRSEPAAKVAAQTVSTPILIPPVSSPAPLGNELSAMPVTPSMQAPKRISEVEVPFAALPANGFVNAPVDPSQAEQLRMEIPRTIVRLLGPADLTTGTATDYEVQVQNPDQLDLNGMILRVEVPAGVDVQIKQSENGAAAARGVELERNNDGATQLIWTVAPLSAGGTARLPLELKASSARNFAVAIEWTVLPQSESRGLTVKQADLQIALEGPVEVEKDVAHVYQLRVSNPGDAVAKNVKVRVNAAAQQANEIEVGDLSPGQTETIEMDLTFEKAGRVDISAHALAGSLKRSTNIAIQVRQSVLEAKVFAPASVPHGASLSAHIELKNSGDATARHLRASLALPTATQLLNLPSGVTQQGDHLVWDIDQIPAGQQVMVPIDLQFANPGTHALQLVCVGPTGSQTSAEATIQVEAFADLKLVVNDPPSPAAVGVPVNYEMSITNRGSRDAQDVKVVAQFSEGIEPQNASGASHRLVPGQVLFDVLPIIAAGETVKLRVVAQATIEGMHRFRVEVRCEENDMRLVEEESTRFLESVGRIASPLGTSIQR